jgi:hypothetical protein
VNRVFQGENALNLQSVPGVARSESTAESVGRQNLHVHLRWPIPEDGQDYVALIADEIERAYADPTSPRRSSLGDIQGFIGAAIENVCDRLNESDLHAFVAWVDGISHRDRTRFRIHECLSRAPAFDLFVTNGTSPRYAWETPLSC